MIVWLLFAGSYIECRLIWFFKFVINLMIHLLVLKYFFTK